MLCKIPANLENFPILLESSSKKRRDTSESAPALSSVARRRSRLAANNALNAKGVTVSRGYQQQWQQCTNIRASSCDGERPCSHSRRRNTSHCCRSLHRYPPCARVNETDRWQAPTNLMTMSADAAASPLLPARNSAAADRRSRARPHTLHRYSASPAQRAQVWSSRPLASWVSTR